MRLNIQLFANEISTTSTSVTLGDTIRVNITTDASYKVTLMFYVSDSKTDPEIIDTSSYITGNYYDYTVKENVYDVLKETTGTLVISGMVESYQGDFIGFTNTLNLNLTVPKLPTKLVNVNKTVSALAIGGKSTAKDDEELFENYMASKFYKDIEATNVVSRNLANANNYLLGHINMSNGGIDEDNNWAYTKVKLKPNTQYTYQLTSTENQEYEVAQYQSNGTYIEGNFGNWTSGKQSYTFTTSNNTDYILIAWRNDLSHSNIQVEEGTTATDYVPYLNLEEAMKGKSTTPSENVISNQVQINNNGKTLTISNDSSGNSFFSTDANQFYFNKRINCESIINQKYKKIFARVAGYVSAPTYYLLAKLPASTAETGDILNIKGYLGGYASNEQAVIDVQIGNRGGLRCNGTWIGVDSYAFKYSRLRLYTNNGETYVYLMTNGWCGNVRLEISGMWNEIYDTFPSTTTPVGTLALDVNEKVLNNASDVYSTDEIVIGKWINDKPIYRKVLDLGSVTTIIGTSHFNHNISNFDVLVNFNIKAYFQSQNAWYNWWEAYQAMTVDVTQIHIHTSAATTFSQVYITLEYTKTTD